MMINLRVWPYGRYYKGTSLPEGDISYLLLTAEYKYNTPFYRMLDMILFFISTNEKARTFYIYLAILFLVSIYRHLNLPTLSLKV